MKIIKNCIIYIFIMVYMLSLSACGHKHIFNQEVISEKYFISDCSAYEKAKYFKSCSCGEKGTEIFYVGEKLMGNLLAPSNTWYKGTTARNKIVKIDIVSQYEEDGTEVEKWDASATSDQSILCYIKDNNLTIYSAEKLYANKNSGVLFSGANSSECFSSLTTITGLELIDTSNVISFVGAFDKCVKLSGQLDLSSWDMSNVLYSRSMFQQCGQTAIEPLDIILNSSLSIYDDFIFNHCATYNKKTFFIPKGVEKIGYMHMWYNLGTKIEDNGQENGLYQSDTAIAVENPLFSEFVVEQGNAYFKTIDGILYDIDGKRLISIPSGKKFNDNTFEIPEGVTWLNELSFSRTNKIDTLILPNSYVIERLVSPDTHEDKTINQGNSLSTAIYCYAPIKNYGVKEDNPNYKSINGCIYSKDGKELIAVPLHYSGNLIIQEGTEIIGKEAFWVDDNKTIEFMSQITQINIAGTIKEIEKEQLDLLNALLQSRPDIIKIDSDNQFYKIEENKIVKI